MIFANIWHCMTDSMNYSDGICRQDILEKDEAEPGEMMECLIEHKHHSDMNAKCAEGVRHHQVVGYYIIIIKKTSMALWGTCVSGDLAGNQSDLRSDIWERNI